MPVLATRIDKNSESFRTGREQMLALIVEFRELEQQVRDASNAKRDLFRKRGQLLPRERVALLLDRGAPWLELSTLAGYRMHDDDGRGGTQAGGGIAGIGYVSGIRCVVAASDSAIKGGTSTPMGVKKNLRVQQIARENKLPRAGADSPTRRACRPRAFPRSPSCTAHRRQAAPICPAFPIT